MKLKNIQLAFTLVELMIVVVILSIVATIGFISYEDYLVDTRDSKRLAQLTSLRDSMRLSITKGSLPLPDNDVEIRNNGQTFMYQGYAGKNVLDSIAFSENTYDPKDEQFYTYLVSTNKKDFQLLGFLEKYNPDVVSFNTSQVFAEDYSQRFPRTVGKKLGILLQQQSNTPIQELSPYTASGFFDLATDTTNTLFDAYVTDTYLISGSGGTLTGIIPFTTCKKILENGDSRGSGYYSINPSGLDPFEVYCDMETDGGGWTLVARSILGSNIGDFGWLYQTGGPRDDTLPYSMGNQTKHIPFSELLFTTYSLGKNIKNAMKYDVKDDFLRKYPDAWYLAMRKGCEFVESDGTLVDNPCTGNLAAAPVSYSAEYIGNAPMKGYFTLVKYHGLQEGLFNPPFGWSDVYNPDKPRFANCGLNSSGFSLCYNLTGFSGQAGMIFVR